MQTKEAPAFRKTTETFVAGAKTLAQRYFVSPDVFKSEQEKILGKHWLLVAHQNQIAQPGEYLVAELLGESLIVVRDQRSSLRAFYNVCRHRGSRLCEGQRGKLRAIQCPYHGWTYSLDGALITAPHMETDDGFDKKSYSLRPVNLTIWSGFVFVNLSSTPIRAEEWFAPISDKFARYNIPELRSARRLEYDVRANWKLIFQNYSECYHCPGVHPELSKLTPYDSAENDLSEGPFLGGFMSIRPGRSLTRSGQTCALPVVAGDGRQDERVFYYSIFPNMLLSLHPDYVMVHQLVPQAADRTLIMCDWLFHRDAFRCSDFNPQDAIEFWDTVNRQDWHVCELSQQGISSRGYTPGPYSPRESIPAAWDREYLRQMSAV